MGNTRYDAAIVPCKDYAPETARAALIEAIDKTTGLDFIKPGTKVVIKANLVAAKKPSTAATTHPVLVSELVKLLKERGAEVVVGDSPGGMFNAAWLSGIYNATGMRMCEEYGAKLNDNYEVKNGDCKGKTLHDFRYTAYLDDADMIIDFAKLKTHGMMVMTGAVKNFFGAIPGITKPEYHSRFPEVESFANMIIDLYEYFKPCISLTDAVYGMEGNGPTAGKPRYVGALIASQSGHIADMVAARVMGIEFQSLPLYTEAVKRGLCPADYAQLNVYGDADSFKVPDYDLICNASSDFSKVMPEPLASISKWVFRTKPALLHPKECVGCKVCYNTCPQKAITMKNNKPAFDYRKCIRCFCCQEFCPKGALEVKRKFIAKLISK